MADVKLTTKQYLAVMRSIAAAMTLEEHTSGGHGHDHEGDGELAELWDGLMDRAEDFGMSFPPEDVEAKHWSDDMFKEADDSLHEFVEAEFTHLLADRLAAEGHYRECLRSEHDNEGCRNDVLGRAMLWEERLSDRAEFSNLIAKMT